MPHLHPRFHGFVQTNQGVLRTYMYSNPDPSYLTNTCIKKYKINVNVPLQRYVIVFQPQIHLRDCGVTQGS